MRKALIALFMILLLPTVFASVYQGSSLEVNEVTLLDSNDLTLSIELHNQNSFDARDILVQFYLPGEQLSSTFPDLDRSEKDKIIYDLDFSSEEDYPLKVVISNDDLHYEETFTVPSNTQSEELEEDSDITKETEETITKESFWRSFLDFLIGLE